MKGFVEDGLHPQVLVFLVIFFKIGMDKSPVEELQTQKLKPSIPCGKMGVDVLF